MAGVSVVLKFKYGSDSVIKLTQFSDDGDPIATQPAQIADGKRTMNGELVTWSTPVTYGVTFTLIPGSYDDRRLRAKLRKYAMRDETAPRYNAAIKSLTIKRPGTKGFGDEEDIANGEEVTFVDGRMREGTPVVGSNSDGKALPSTYSFMFKDIQYTQID